MMTYVTAFIFYTLAMIGILLIGFVVYKKTFMTEKGENKGYIKVIDSLPIGNKKLLLVVKIKNEKFLIASGLEHTTFLSKLEDDNIQKEEVKTPVLNNFVDENLVDKIYDETFSQRNQQKLYDENKKARLDELQRQFKELYEKEETKPKITDSMMSKKEMLKRLLKD